MKIASYCSLLFICLLMVSCKTSSKTSPKKITASDLKVYESFDDLQPLLSRENDTTYVINFWATWCKPCVAELPYFEQIHENYKTQKVKVLLVSLDFRNMIETKLVPFINDRNLQPEVVVLADQDANSWIDKISPTWSGAIPATIVQRSSKREFHEAVFENYEELSTIVNQFLK